jgi:hypothetical protein
MNALEILQSCRIAKNGSSYVLITTHFFTSLICAWLYRDVTHTHTKRDYQISDRKIHIIKFLLSVYRTGAPTAWLYCILIVFVKTCCTLLLLCIISLCIAWFGNQMWRIIYLLRSNATPSPVYFWKPIFLACELLHRAQMWIFSPCYHTPWLFKDTPPFCSSSLEALTHLYWF